MRIFNTAYIEEYDYVWISYVVTIEVIGWSRFGGVTLSKIISESVQNHPCLAAQLVKYLSVYLFGYGYTSLFAFSPGSQQV